MTSGANGFTTVVSKAGCQRNNLRASVIEKRINADDERAGAQLDKLSEGCVDFTYRAGIQDM
jgi:hypothetical protein